MCRALRLTASAGKLCIKFPLPRGLPRVCSAIGARQLYRTFAAASRPRTSDPTPKIVFSGGPPAPQRLNERSAGLLAAPYVSAVRRWCVFSPYLWRVVHNFIALASCHLGATRALLERVLLVGRYGGVYAVGVTILPAVASFQHLLAVPFGGLLLRFRCRTILVSFLPVERFGPLPGEAQGYAYCVFFIFRTVFFSVGARTCSPPRRQNFPQKKRCRGTVTR